MVLRSEPERRYRGGTGIFHQPIDDKVYPQLPDRAHPIGGCELFHLFFEIDGRRGLIGVGDGAVFACRGFEENFDNIFPIRADARPNFLDGACDAVMLDAGQVAALP